MQIPHIQKTKVALGWQTTKDDGLPYSVIIVARMALGPSSRLGPYEIIDRLGAGGMGEVYRARDGRLGRDVALKVLPADVANDPARKARFEQEARAAAALNHPNIVGVHDVGSEDGVAYLVTELVPGETLAAVIERGPLAIRKLLDIAVQVADGMAAAHAARITHRDLKPANIMITPDGRAKILDFGLARQAAPAAANPDQTVTVHQTEPGMILGTVNYMSPEQARGKPVDYRSDQFSFGLILYEMATGKRPFEKPESVQTLSAILTDDPPPIERSVPAPLRWAIDRCLAKDPEGRYESTRDLHQELRNLRDHQTEFTTAQAPAAEPVSRTARRRWWPLPAALALGVVAALGARYLLSGPAMPDQSMYRYTPFSFMPGVQHDAVWSPDGKAVAYAAGQTGALRVYLRYLDSPLPTALTQPEKEVEPLRFSPDGNHILFFSSRNPRGIWSVAAVGGEPQPVAAIPDEARGVDVSPDNQSIAIFQPDSAGRKGIWISSPPGAPWKKYLPDPFAMLQFFNAPRIKFSADGKRLLLIVDGEHLEEKCWLAPYPANSSDPPKTVLPKFPHDGGTPTFCWMPDNRHIMASSSVRAGAWQLWLADTASGEFHAITSGTKNALAPAVSPDGARVIFQENSGSYDVVSVDLSTAIPCPVIATQRDEMAPSWAAKAPLMSYFTDRNGEYEIWLHGPESTDRPLVNARQFPGSSLMGPALSPDGGRVIYTVFAAGREDYLWISSVAGGAPVRLTNRNLGAEFPGSWSPDGASFTYVMWHDGQDILMKVMTTGQATPVELKSGVWGEVPIWSPTGEWIAIGDLLVSPDGKTVRSIGNHHTPGWGFSRDGKLLYGIREDHGRELLFSVDVASGAEKVIGDVGKDYAPLSNLNPSIRFDLTPDGKSVTYSTGVFQSGLWMLEGFKARRGFWR